MLNFRPKFSLNKPASWCVCCVYRDHSFIGVGIFLVTVDSLRPCISDPPSSSTSSICELYVCDGDGDGEDDAGEDDAGEDDVGEDDGDPKKLDKLLDAVRSKPACHTQAQSNNQTVVYTKFKMHSTLAAEEDDVDVEGLSSSSVFFFSLFFSVM